MYLHLGVGKVIRTKDIVGIFDIDKTTLGSVTKGFLSNAERAGKVHTVGNDIGIHLSDLTRSSRFPRRPRGVMRNARGTRGTRPFEKGLVKTLK